MPVQASTIAAFLNLKLLGADVMVRAVSPLNRVQAQELTFASRFDPATAEALNRSGAVALVAPEYDTTLTIPHMLCWNPRLEFIRAVREFFAPPPAQHRIAETARIAPGTALGQNVDVGEYAIIEAGVQVGDNTVLGNHVILRQGTVVGRDCAIEQFTVIGNTGFAFEQDEEGQFFNLPHLGRVIIGENVQIGAFCTIDRGTIDDTTIGCNVRINDQVFIGHNVQVSDGVVLHVRVTLSGSSSVGKGAIIAPQSVIRNKVSIGEQTLIGMGSVVTKPVEPRVVAFGNPAVVHRKRFDDSSISTM
jgi:UDP-3-O-[3-hydroxymyristoyl] glucosamine N-acyltransferase